MDTYPELAGALLRLPAKVREDKAHLGTATRKDRRRTVQSLRKEHGGPHPGCGVCDSLWLLEWELKQPPSPSRQPPHGRLAALLLLKAHWGRPVSTEASRITGEPADPFFHWAAAAITDAYRHTTPEALRMVWRRFLPSK
jgi:hypothetical protein